jgi:ectoine hydroxylase-related dioxygenase (phytanoyl-CoA dioxygenase family)
MDDLASLVEEFHREGFLVLRNVLSPEEVAVVRAGVEKAFEGPPNGYGNNIRVCMFERGPEFEALIDHPNIVPVVEAILGPDCHLIAQSALRTGPNESVAPMFHCDEVVRFPIPDGVELDPRIQMPVFIVNLNIYLVDVDEELGPTELVPGSHRAGRNPRPDADGRVEYNGRKPVMATGKAGDVVLWHDQTWHRGAPNRSKDRVRFVQQGPYAKRFISQRFYPFVNYRMPDEILARANPRRKRLLGLHGRGAYG